MEKKELVKRIRLLVNKGQKANRETYLALAFARKVPYVVLEKIINEDKFERPVGCEKWHGRVFGFLSGLAYMVSFVLEKAVDPDKKATGNVYKEQVYEWMMVKYAAPAVEESSTSQAAE